MTYLRVRKTGDLSRMDIAQDVSYKSAGVEQIKGHLKLGSPVIDLSSSRLDADNGGTLDGVTITEATKVAGYKALEFDGVSDGLIVPSVSWPGSAGGMAAAVRIAGGGEGVAADPAFRLAPTVSGYSALPASMTINGTTKQPTFRFTGAGWTSSAWVDDYGLSFAEAQSGAEPTQTEYVPGLGEYGVVYGAGKTHVAANNTVGAIGTADFVLETIFSRSAATNCGFLGKSTSSADLVVIFSTSSIMRIYFTSTLISSVAYTNFGEFIHCIAFADRSRDIVLYLNGVRGGVVDISAQAANNIGAGGPWTLGGYIGATSRMAGTMSYAALWQGESWLDSGEQDALAKERFARACGVWPELAAGGKTPTTQTRASAAYLQKKDSNGHKILVPVGNNWMRVEDVKDSADEEAVAVNIGPARKNVVLQSGNISDAAWTKSECTVGEASTTKWGLAHESIIPSANAAGHYIEQAVTLDGTGDNCVSALVAPGNKTYFKFNVTNESNTSVYFNSADTTFYNKGSNISETWWETDDDGGYRVMFKFSATGTSRTLRIQPATDSSTDSFTGDAATAAMHIRGIQVEQGKFPTSLIATGAAAATRAADVLIYPGGDSIGPAYNVSGRMRVDVLAPLVDNPGSDVKVCGFEDAAGGNQSYIQVSADETELNIAGGGASPGIVTVAENHVHTGTIRTLVATWAVDDVELTVEGTSVGTDTDAEDTPESITKIYVGHFYNASYAGVKTIRLEFGESSTFTPAVLMGGLADATNGPFVGYRYNVATDDYTLLACATDDGVAEIESTGTLEPDTWYFIRFHWDATSRKIYIDEVEDASETVAGSASSTPDYWALGWGVVGSDEDSYAEAALAEAIIYEEVADGYFDAIVAAGVPADTANLVTELSPRSKSAGIIAPDTEGGWDAEAQGGTLDGWFLPGTDSTERYTELGQPLDISDQALVISSTHPAFAADLVTGPEGTFAFSTLDGPYTEAYYSRNIAAVLSNGKIVILRTGGTTYGRVYCYDPTTDVATLILGGGGGTSGVFSLAVSPDGTKAIVATGIGANTEIRQTADGTTWDGIFGEPSGDMWSSVTKLAIDNDGNTIFGRSNGDSDGIWVNETAFAGAKTFSSIDAVCWFQDVPHVFDGSGDLHRLVGGAWEECGHPYSSGSSNDARECCVIEFNDELWAGYANGDWYSWSGTAWTGRGDPGDSGGGWPSNPVVIEDKLWCLVKDSTGSKLQVYEYNSGTTWTLLGDTGITSTSNTYVAVANARVPGEYGAYFAYNTGADEYTHSIGRVLLGGVEQVAPHTVAGWWVIEGGSDQTLWCTEEPSTWADKIRERMWFDASENLVYYELSDDTTAWSISAPVTPNLLTHIATSRSVTEGESTIRLYINGLIASEATFADGGGAPGEDILIGVDDLSLHSYQLFGRINQFRIYDAVLSEAQMTSLYAAGSAVITAGPYATQAITPTTAITPLSLDMSGDDDGFVGYPVFMYQEVENGPWRAAAVGNADPTWAFHDFFLDNGIYAFRLYAKAPLGFPDIEAGFDNVDGGEQVLDQTILPATVDKERRAALERLILQYKPLHTWCVEVIDFE